MILIIAVPGYQKGVFFRRVCSCCRGKRLSFGSDNTVITGWIYSPKTRCMKGICESLTSTHSSDVSKVKSVFATVAVEGRLDNTCFDYVKSVFCDVIVRFSNCYNEITKHWWTFRVRKPDNVLERPVLGHENNSVDAYLIMKSLYH